MNLEALKSRESELLRELETKNIEKKNNLQKHRQILLNSAHFLRLYHQSSLEAKDLLTTHNENNIQNYTVGSKNETDEINIKEEDGYVIELSLISKNGLRFLWDALESEDFFRASLLLQFFRFKQKDLPDISSNSLNYFEEKLKNKIIHELVLKTDPDIFLFYCLFLISEVDEGDALLFIIKKHCEKDFEASLEDLKKFLNNLSLFLNLQEKHEDNLRTRLNVNIFIETSTNYCEFPQLKLYKNQSLQNQTNIFETSFKEEINCKLNSIKSQIFEFANKKITEDLKSGILFDSPSILLIKEIGLNPDIIELITSKLNEVQLKNSSDYLKSHLSDFFDCLMKHIQSIIRTASDNINNYSFSTEESILKNKIQSLCQLMLSSSKLTPQLLSSLIQSFQPTLTNKSNIILTIHRNELASFNSKREIPTGSKLYLAVQLYHQIKLYIQQDYNQSSNPLIVCFLSEVHERIANTFFTNWVTEIRAAFLQLSTIDQHMALFWLSDLFLRLQVTPEDSQSTLKQLNLINCVFNNKDNNFIIKEHYANQAALLIGLHEPKKNSVANSPQHSTQSTRPSKSLLPHFVPNL